MIGPIKFGMLVGFMFLRVLLPVSDPVFLQTTNSGTVTELDLDAYKIGEYSNDDWWLTDFRYLCRGEGETFYFFCASTDSLICMNTETKENQVIPLDQRDFVESIWFHEKNSVFCVNSMTGQGCISTVYDLSGNVQWQKETDDRGGMISHGDGWIYAEKGFVVLLDSKGIEYKRIQLSETRDFSVSAGTGEYIRLAHFEDETDEKFLRVFYSVADWNGQIVSTQQGVLWAQGVLLRWGKDDRAYILGIPATSSSWIESGYVEAYGIFLTYRDGTVKKLGTFQLPKPYNNYSIFITATMEDSRPPYVFGCALDQDSGDEFQFFAELDSLFNVKQLCRLPIGLDKQIVNAERDGDRLLLSVVNDPIYRGVCEIWEIHLEAERH